MNAKEKSVVAVMDVLTPRAVSAASVQLVIHFYSTTRHSVLVSSLLLIGRLSLAQCPMDEKQPLLNNSRGKFSYGLSFIISDGGAFGIGRRGKKFK